MMTREIIDEVNIDCKTGMMNHGIYTRVNKLMKKNKLFKPSKQEDDQSVKMEDSTVSSSTANKKQNHFSPPSKPGTTLKDRVKSKDEIQELI